jgi:mannose-6-phosphate isomerase-like protein (cupin superfamily)
MSQATRPSLIRHYEAIRNDDTAVFRGTNERRSIGSPFSKALGLTKLGIHHELLPGRRTSLPHAESAEEEFVYVIDGTPDVSIDGELFRLAPGDGGCFPAGGAVEVAGPGALWVGERAPCMDVWGDEGAACPDVDVGAALCPDGGESELRWAAFCGPEAPRPDGVI